jgi:hypothetical protein
LIFENAFVIFLVGLYFLGHYISGKNSKSHAVIRMSVLMQAAVAGVCCIVVAASFFVGHHTLQPVRPFHYSAKDFSSALESFDTSPIWHAADSSYSVRPIYNWKSAVATARNKLIGASFKMDSLSVDYDSLQDIWYIHSEDQEDIPKEDEKYRANSMLLHGNGKVIAIW